MNKGRERKNDIYLALESKRMQLARALFSPQSNVDRVRNAQNVLRLAGDLVVIAGRFAEAEEVYYSESKDK